MQFGAVFPQTEFGNDPIAIRDYVQAVEGMGYSHLIVYDHVLSADLSSRPDFSGPYHLDHPFHEIFVLLGFVAGQTTSLGLVPAVLILPQRQTALVAKQAAEVDVLSSGRLRLGVGVGWNKVEYDGLGMDFSSRGERSEEQIALLRRLWTNPSATFEGRWDHIDAAGINPLPVQRPIPIWIGGYADVTMQRIGELGDGWFPWKGINNDTRRSLGLIRESAVRVGRDPTSIGLEPRLGVGSGSAAEWSAFVREWEDLGASHCCFDTMGNGFATPNRHLLALERAATEFGISTLR